ncbi:MAG: VCBS repeat-containing protein [Cytophagales bacterium]|nr:VCBS repeat-containing protein [Cytophagales bacterium]
MIVEQVEVFPQKPVLNAEKWQLICDYYLHHAPDSLAVPEPKLQYELKNFQLRKPQYKLSPPSTTLVKFHDREIFVGDANTKAFYLFDNQLNLKNAANVKEGAVWAEPTDQRIYLTVMGSFSPTDTPSGFLMSLPRQAQEKTKVLLKNLQRPVHSDFGDLNGDGLEDIVVCEFAKWTGCLAWWENKGSDQYEKHLLRPKPGAIKAYIRDMNQDGRPDIVTLFGQGDEGIFIYFNQGNGQFEERRVITLEPSYGSSYFNLFDFNEDGHLDIIYTAGDNADYPPILKPYHGIRIYLNNGHNEFKEDFFYPLPGAYQAIPTDFDQDGDLDIAAISFFPNYDRQPAAGFVYLENQGNMKFKAHTFPEVNQGRWIVMDVGDMEGDGDQDIILGSLTFEVPNKQALVQQWVDQALPFVVLENTTRQRPMVLR